MGWDDSITIRFDALTYFEAPPVLRFAPRCHEFVEDPAERERLMRDAVEA